MKRTVSILLVLVTIVAIVAMTGCGTTYRYRGATTRPAVDGATDGATSRTRGNTHNYHGRNHAGGHHTGGHHAGGHHAGGRHHTGGHHHAGGHHAGGHHHADGHRRHADGSIMPGVTPGLTSQDGLRNNPIAGSYGHATATTSAPIPNVPDPKRPSAPQTEDAKRSNTPAPTPNAPAPKSEKPLKPAS